MRTLIGLALAAVVSVANAAPTTLAECHPEELKVSQQRLHEAFMRSSHEKQATPFLQPKESVDSAMSNMYKVTDKVHACQKQLPGAKLGMTTKQVEEETSWGFTQEKHTTTTAAGTNEQWVYGGRNYLYFTNGRLTAIQN